MNVTLIKIGRSDRVQGACNSRQQYGFVSLRRLSDCINVMQRNRARYLGSAKSSNTRRRYDHESPATTINNTQPLYVHGLLQMEQSVGGKTTR